jgi:hypothetical protein
MSALLGISFDAVVDGKNDVSSTGGDEQDFHDELLYGCSVM